MITEEIAVVGSVYCLSLRDSVVQYHSINVICHNEHRLHITLCRAHCLWTRSQDTSIHLIVASNVVRTSEPKFRPE